MYMIAEDTQDTYKITLREKVSLRDTQIYTYGKDLKDYFEIFYEKGVVT